MSKEEVQIELNGQVYLKTYKRVGDNALELTEQTEIPSLMVLRLIEKAIKEGLKKLEEEDE